MISTHNVLIPIGFSCSFFNFFVNYLPVRPVSLTLSAICITNNTVLLNCLIFEDCDILIEMWKCKQFEFMTTLAKYEWTYFCNLQLKSTQYLKTIGEGFNL